MVLPIAASHDAPLLFGLLHHPEGRAVWDDLVVPRLGSAGLAHTAFDAVLDWVEAGAPRGDPKHVHMDACTPRWPPCNPTCLPPGPVLGGAPPPSWAAGEA